MLIRFDSKNTNDKEGNKGKFLIQMKAEGFNVSDGIVLDRDTYIETIKQNKIEDKIAKLLKELNKDNVSEISKKIQKLFNKVELSKEVVKEINDNIRDTKFAVRSSGVKEDLDDHSFAGQYETFLNVPKSKVAHNVINCYKSMFSEVILSYLVNNNISTEDLYMSVVIQEMVNSEYSGVCFTIDPVNGNDKTMLIEVGKGIGENIVSGKVKVEQYRYNWYEKEFEDYHRNKFVKDPLLTEMAEMFFKIHLLFGYPCDIEFAIEKGKCYILQARRITKIQYNGIKDIWSTADFKDGGVSATICKPYMWSLYDYIWEYVLRKFIIDSKILKDNEMPKLLGEMYFARCYWNLSTVKKAMSKVVGYNEREFDSEYGIKGNYEGDGQVTKITLKSLVDIIRMALAQKKILKTRNDNAENYKQDLLNKYFDYKKKYDEHEIEDIKKDWKKLTHDTYLQSESTYFWQIFINTIHQSLYKDGLLKYVSGTEYLTLLSSIDDISHMRPFYKMWDISRKIKNDKKQEKYWTTTPVDKIAKDFKKGLKENSFEDVKEVIDEFGYHSDSELDVTYPCYYEDIIPILTNIRDTIPLDDSFSPEKDQKEGKEKIQSILDNLEKNNSKSKYKKVHKKITNMRKMLWWREEFRDISTRFYYLIRVYTIELAKELVKEDILEDADDIWFLRVEHIWQFLDGELDKEGLYEIISKNKDYYNAYRNYMSENEIGSNFGEIVSDKSSIKGLGANSGEITGRARVINSFNEIDKLQPGEILVTKFTDTGWTPKFAIIKGIITEYGGILCHAAIVSREYGIPAIVSTSDVMKKIHDGDIITMNGSTGIIKITGREE